MIIILKKFDSWSLRNRDITWIVMVKLCWFLSQFLYNHQECTFHVVVELVGQSSLQVMEPLQVVFSLCFKSLFFYIFSLIYNPTKTIPIMQTYGSPTNYHIQSCKHYSQKSTNRLDKILKELVRKICEPRIN